MSYKKKQLDPLDLIKSGGGWHYWCTECSKKFRFKQLIPTDDLNKIFQYLACPECGEIILDLKRK